MRQNKDSKKLSENFEKGLDKGEKIWYNTVTSKDSTKLLNMRVWWNRQTPQTFDLADIKRECL